ncbi:MAG TPA: diguanylate cyclase [Rudaea sp.]|jgi:diguanylate cyclase (GGDEF)-like protein/PAS domain S-box-containing protein
MQQAEDRTPESVQHTALLARLLTANLRDLVVWLRADGVRLFMSDAVAELLGWTREEAAAMPPLAMVDPADRPQIQQALTRLFAEGGEAIETFRGCHKDGREVWLEALGRRVHEDAVTGMPSIIYTARDVTARLSAERALAESRRQLQTIADSMPALILQLDVRKRVVFANAHAAARSERTPAQMLETSLRDAMGDDAYALAAPHIDAALRGERGRYERELEIGGELRVYEFLCLPESDSGSASRGAYLFGYDITHRKLVEKNLNELARTDMLTGLSNRRDFDERLEQGLARRKAAPQALALMLIDLDRFKEINDTLGHLAGDTVLKAVAARLREAAFDIDVLARLGGDEFAILLGDAGAAESAELLAARLKVAMSRPIPIIGSAVTVTLSIGIAYCHGELSARDLTHLADRALYEAKESGRNTHRALRAESAG